MSTCGSTHDSHDENESYGDKSVPVWMEGQSEASVQSLTPDTMQSADSGESGLESLTDHIPDQPQENPTNCQAQNQTSTPPKIGTRFSSSSLRILRNWFSNHERHPYPNSEAVELLKHQTGLSRQQVTSWFANARRRSKFQLSRPLSPLTRGWTEPPPCSQTEQMEIPPRRATPVPFQDMNPLQRWQNSPPEHEAATASDISRAVVASSSTTSLQNASRASGRSSGNASSAGSEATSQSSKGVWSDTSANSRGSWKTSTSFDSGKRGPTRRRRRVTAGRQKSKRLTLRQTCHTYHCTFCIETFKTKYDWQRHEKSLHLSLEEWVCSSSGSTALHQEKGVVCVYCGEISPDQAHLNTHNYGTCLERPLEERTFYRKDHLRQHLKLVHSASYSHWPMEQWKVAIKEIRSRCGFCGIFLDTWSRRVDHLGEHFKSGSTMEFWEGNWGFDAQVMEMVDNALPPYLIHQERNSPLPLSVTQGPAYTPISAYELIKIELEYYMQNYFDTHGLLPSDHDLQYESCSIVFGAEFLVRSSALTAPSWLRDIIMSSVEIAEQARLRPMKNAAESRMTQLKVNGKLNIFDQCDLEHQLACQIAIHDALGLVLSEVEIQQEACNVLRCIEASSPNPSRPFLDFLSRLIWGSNHWVTALRERTQVQSVGSITNEDMLFGVNNIEPLAPLPYPTDTPLALLESIQDNAGLTQTSNQGGMTLGNLEHAPSLAARTLLSTDINDLPIVNDEWSLSTSSDSTYNDHYSTAWKPAEMTTAAAPVYSFSGGKTQPFFLNDKNCFRRLARELSRFVATTMSPKNPNSHVPVDDELRYQARWILYDDDDPWNQTPADNFEWLREFKRDVGLLVDDSSSGTDQKGDPQLAEGGTPSFNLEQANT